MKFFLLFALFLFQSPSYSMEWPWFFAETAFKNWLIDKNVKCLKYVSADLPFEYAKSRGGWRCGTKGITTYVFDQNGVLEYVKIEEFAVGLYPDSLFTEDNYYFILDKLLPSLPLKIEDPDNAKMREYNESKLFPGIKSSSWYGGSRTAAPDGTVFAETNNFFVNRYAAFPFYYRYRLNQEIYLTSGEISSLRNYYLSTDACCNHIPTMGTVTFEAINDSISILSEKSHNLFLDTYNFIGKDTIITYPYYHKISHNKSHIEFGMRTLDSLGGYCYVPLSEIIMDETTNEKTEIVTQVHDHHLTLRPITIYLGLEDYRYLSNGNIFRVTDEHWCWSSCYNMISSYMRVEKTKTVTKSDKKTGEISEKKIYHLENDAWELVSEETNTKEGYLQKHYWSGDKKPIYQIKITLDENQNPVFVKETNDDQEIIFRISGDSIYLPEEDARYGAFLIEYD